MSRIQGFDPPTGAGAGDHGVHSTAPHTHAHMHASTRGARHTADLNMFGTNLAPTSPGGGSPGPGARRCSPSATGAAAISPASGPRCSSRRPRPDGHGPLALPARAGAGVDAGPPGRAACGRRLTMVSVGPSARTSYPNPKFGCASKARHPPWLPGGGPPRWRRPQWSPI